MLKKETAAAAASFARLHTQATESVRRDAQRVREVSERFREVYRRRLEDWLQQRARLDQQLGRSRATGPALEQLRSEHEALGRELAALQTQLMRTDVAARQLELVTSYLASPDPQADEPTLADVDLSPASLSLRIIQAQEGERQHLAEEIHDGPAQVLTNAIFQVEYLDRVIDDSPRTAHAELAFLRTMLRDSLDEVRSFIAALRPPPADLGLAEAIRGAGKDWALRNGIPVGVAVDGIDERVAAEAKAPVLRIVQEALQNVRKHAAASAVRIGLEGDHLVIVDNGRGFDVMRLASPSRNFGLQFMRERAELMGSSLQIESRQGEGTRILLRIPEVN
ncbi:MAG TPA: sensor histidine kinase [Candidatus Saccharimonadales bacterium]|nr:sensor histidine kinase [Candidatus Saccharimonadales bacterium]